VYLQENIFLIKTSGINGYKKDSPLTLTRKIWNFGQVCSPRSST
jgi:hypothetical protein